MSNYRSLDEVIQDMAIVPFECFRANEYKILRESWCVAMALKALGLLDYKISPSPDQQDSADSYVIDPNAPSRIYRFQVAEIAPRKPQAVSVLADAMTDGYGNLKQELYELISTAVAEKDVKYAKADKSKLNLLIYFNAPSGQEDADTGCAPTVITNFKLDLDMVRFEEMITDFGSIIFMSGEEAALIKGHNLS